MLFIKPKHPQYSGFRRKTWGHHTKPRLLEQVRVICLQKHFSPKTDKSYVLWIRQYILFHGRRHPEDMGQKEIEVYLNHLATKRCVSASTQSGALNAIAFLYRKILREQIPESRNLRHIRRYQAISVIMSTQDVASTLDRMHGRVSGVHEAAEILKF
jgi:site-specific recombinase XerD